MMSGYMLNNGTIFHSDWPVQLSMNFHSQTSQSCVEYHTYSHYRSDFRGIKIEQCTVVFLYVHILSSLIALYWVRDPPTTSLYHCIFHCTSMLYSYQMISNTVILRLLYSLLTFFLSTENWSYNYHCSVKYPKVSKMHFWNSRLEALWLELYMCQWQLVLSTTSCISEK